MKNPGILGNTEASTTRRPLGAAHAEAAVEHRVGRAGADRARSARVVAPGTVAHEVAKLRLGLHVAARQDLARPAAVGPEPLVEPADEAHAVDHGREIVVAPIDELPEGDHRHVARIGAAQRDPAGGVLRVRLQDRPR